MQENPGPGAIYLFCFARSALLSAVEGNGVDGKNPLFLLAWRDIVVVASYVSREECCGYSSEDRMLDIAWVGPRACRHEEVVEQAMRHSPVLPVGLGTIFDSVQSLENSLKDHLGTIGLFLDRVSGRDEWAVKGFWTRLKPDEGFSSIISSQSEQLSPSAGSDYLQQRRSRAAGANALKRSLHEACETLAGELGRIADEVCVRKVLSREVVGGDKDMIINWAFLVPRNAVTDFRAQIALADVGFASLGLSLELSGPWPPYSFCPSLWKEVSP